MSNFARQFPAGVPANGTLPSGKADYWDVAISKSVNGDDGSSHAGFVTLGQIKSSHITSKLGVAGVLTASATIGLDLSVSSQIEIVNQGLTNEDKSWTVNLSNVLSGDIIIVTLDASTLDSTHQVSMSWGGAGLTHRLSPGDGSPTVGPVRMMWVGRATSGGTSSASAADIWWTCTRY